MHADTHPHVEILHRLIEEIWNQRRIERMASIFDEAVVMHYAGRDLHGLAALRDELIVPFQAAFPDMVRRIDDLLVDGDRAALRFSASGVHAGTFAGRAASHRRLAFEVIALFRLRGGRIAEVWAHSDFAARFDAL